MKSPHLTNENAAPTTHNNKSTERGEMVEMVEMVVFRGQQTTWRDRVIK